MLKNAAVISVVTFISRILGYLRDMLIAAKLGAGIYNDIFVIILRIPNMFRCLFAEGAFTNAFVPIYSNMLVTENKKLADKFAMQLQSLLTITVIIVSLLLFILMPQVIALLIPGIQDEYIRELAVSYARITLPFLPLMTLTAFYGGMLNAIDRYFAFATAPIFFNLALIISCFFAIDEQTQLIYLSYGVVIAGFIELLWVLSFFYFVGFRIKIKLPTLNTKIKLLLKRLGPIVLGSGVTQINTIVDTVLASFIINGISYLYYAERIYQLPLALLGTAMGVAMLSPLSKALARNDQEKANMLHNRAIEWLLMFALPSTVGLLLLSEEIVGLLFQHGNFDALTTYHTKNALIAFVMGLPAVILIKVFITNFYAHGDTKTPVKIAALCIVSNLVFSLALMPFIQHAGIALASSISAWLNLGLLWYMLRKKDWFILEKRLYKAFRDYALCCVLMGVAILAVKYYVMGQLLVVICSMICSGIIYFGGLHILRKN